MAYVSLTIRDYSDELSNIRIPIDEVDPLVDDIVELDDELTDLAAAINAVTLGNIARQSLTVFETAPNDARPASPWAQRETGLRIYYQTTGDPVRKGTVTVPAPNLDALTIPGGTDEVTLADSGAMAALVSALETHMEVDGQAVTITKAVVVGRNS